MTITTATSADEILRFAIHELRTIRPGLPAELNPQARYRADLNLDSLDLVELVARLEQRYGLLVPDADLPQFVSIDATVRYVLEHVAP